MSREKGAIAEEKAVQYLASHGFAILARNYTVRGAEIDIIAKEGDAIVFVEVKSRASMRYAAPRESVTQGKRRRICMAALFWLQAMDLSEANIRFDIVECTYEGLALLRSAFEFVEPR